MAEAVRPSTKKKGKSKVYREGKQQVEAIKNEVEINSPPLIEHLETSCYVLDNVHSASSEPAEVAEEAVPSEPVVNLVTNGDAVMETYQVKIEASPVKINSTDKSREVVQEDVSVSAPSLYGILQESLGQLQLEAKTDVKQETPSAPAVLASEPMGLFEIDLPRDRLSENITFSSSLEDCVARVIQEQQQHFSELKTFTSEQLKMFYENSLLDGEETIVESFLDCRKNLEIHPLYESLSCFLRCRLALRDTLEELAVLDRDIEAAASQLWTVTTKKVVYHGLCSDGKRVKAQEEFPVAHFDQKAASQVSRQLKLQREKIQEVLTLSVYESQWWKLRIDSLICNSAGQEHGSMSVIFAFLRRPAKDRVFVDQLKYWLNYVTVSILRRARKEEYLFIAHHILRCPAGLTRWARPYLQAPYYDLSGDNEEGNKHHIDVILALLSAICKPVRSRQEFLDSWNADKQDDDHPWVWLDSEGEDEEGDGVNLTDDDLLALISQLPLANIFRYAFRLRQRDQVDVQSGTQLENGQWLKAYSICRQLLSILESGLRTHEGVRYKNLAKKLAQLVLHTVSNVVDMWRDHWQSWRPTDESMMERLLREYEHLVSEGLNILIRTRQQRSWQLLSRIPLSGLTHRVRLDLWLNWHSEICGESIELEFIKADTFWNLLCSKLIQLPEPDLFVFLVTLSSMASSPENWPASHVEDPFLQLIAWELTEIGLLSETTRELCFRTSKDLLISLAGRHPPIVSFVMERLKGTEQQPSSTLIFFKELPLSQWYPTDSDFELLRDWLLNGALDSTRHQLAVTILTRLNWALESGGGTRPFLSSGFHQKMALLLVEVVSIHGRLPAVVPSSVVPAMASNFLSDSVQFLASFSRSWNSTSLVQWAWHLVLKLRLHTFDCYPEHLLWMLHHPGRAFRHVRQLQDDPQFQILRTNVALPFSCFVALSVTSAGHSLPEFCSAGIDLLVTLSTSGQHTAVLVVLGHLFPLLVTCPDALYSQTKLLDVFQRLIQADYSYYKQARNLLVSQFPGSVLLMLASLMETTISKLSGLNLAGSIPAPELWLNLLTRLPKWNADKSILYLLDVLVRTTWPDPSSGRSFRHVLSVMLQESNQVQRPAKGLASRVGSWVSGSTETVGQLDATELIQPSPSLLYLSWMVLDLEMERQAKLWQIIVAELQPGKPKSLDQALKSAASTLKISAISVTQLCLARYAQLAVEMSSEHPLFPLILQRFFGLYFNRAETGLLLDVGGGHHWAVGQRIMTYSAALSSLLKQLVFALVDAVKRLQSTDTKSVSFFQSCILWLEDARLLESQVYLPSLAPNYRPDLLLQLFQGSDLWLDLCRLDTVQRERQELRDLWNKERNFSAPVAQHVIRFQSPSGEILTSRLQSHSDPIRLAQVVIQPAFNRLPPTFFMKVSELRSHLNRHLEMVTIRAEQCSQKAAELTALDCQYAELLPEQFSSSKVERQVAAKCAGTQTGKCSGAAVIRLTCEPWRANASIRSQAESNRQEATRLRATFHQDPTVKELCVAALLVDDCVEFIRTSSDPSVLETGAALFYILVELVNEETNSYPPAKQLLSTCLEILGQKCVAGHPEQCRNLVGLLNSNPGLAGLVAPHFTPSTTDPPSGAAIDAFLDSYRLVTALSKRESDLILVLLTKFDVHWWLNCSHCWPADRSKLLDAITAALDTYGPTPAEKALAAHEILRRHWQLILSHNFPEQYGRVLQLLLRSSETQSCSPVLWCDLINSLGQGWLRFRLESSVEEFRQQVLQYTTEQTMLKGHQFVETATVLSQHFSKERQVHGLYGLYPKYRAYVHVISCFSLMIGHGLCFATLQNDPGTPSDLLVSQLWAVIRDLYSPWILPYTQQQVSNNCASWIQQLSSDRKLLLPWIAADSGQASLMATSAALCVSFLHESVPAQQSVLSHLLTFYLHGFCHPAVKPHIFQVIHQALESLMWNTFVPSLADLEQLVRATAQFLPEVHSFLVSLFVRLPISGLIQQWRAQPVGLTRLLACLLHLYVRLAGEPTAQQNPVMKRILDEACSYPWHFIDASIYDQVLNWYVSTSDPLFVIQPYMERFETTQSSNDALVFRLLQAASGYQSSVDQPDSVVKRQMFIRSWIRLISLNVSRHRAVVQRHPSAIQNAVDSLLEFVVQKNTPAEYSTAFHEYLTAMVSPSSPIAEALQNGVCQRLESTSVNPVLFETVLRISSTLHGDLIRVAAVMESALEHFDGPRSTVYALLPADGGGTKELSSTCWKQGCFLSWYCLVSIQEGITIDDGPYILDQLLACCKLINLSDVVEPKLCLVYERLMSVLSLSADFSKQKTALKADWSELLSSWAEDSKSWLSSIGLGKTPRLSSKGRFLARVMSCCIQPSPEGMEELERLAVNRHYADCKTAAESALEILKSSSIPDGKALLQRLVPLLYSRPYLTRLMMVA